MNRMAAIIPAMSACLMPSIVSEMVVSTPTTRAPRRISLNVGRRLMKPMIGRWKTMRAAKTSPIDFPYVPMNPLFRDLSLAHSVTYRVAHKGVKSSDQVTDTLTAGPPTGPLRGSPLDCERTHCGLPR